MGDWVTDTIKQTGGQPTAATIGFLRSWQRWEGGHTNNKASFNWLNRTDQGYPTINSVGVAAYPDYQTGIARTTDLLRSGYPSIYNALRTGQVNYNDPSIQGDLNRWLTGKRTPGMTPYVRKIAGTAGQDVGAAPVQTEGIPAAADAPSFSRGNDRASAALQLVGALRARRENRDQGALPFIGQLMQIRSMMNAGGTPAAPPAPSMGGLPVPAGAGAGGVGSSPGGGIRELFYDPIGAYDEGKWINPIGGHSDHVHVSFGKPDVAMAAIKMAQAMGLRASENPYAEGSPAEPGVHTKTSYHYRNFPGTYDGRQLGMGLDVSGDAQKMAAYFKALKGRYLR